MYVCIYIYIHMNVCIYGCTCACMYVGRYICYVVVAFVNVLGYVHTDAQHMVKLPFTGQC